MIEKAKENTACAYRLALLFVSHLTDEISFKVEACASGRAMSIAITQYAAETGRNRTLVIHDRSEGRNYLALLEDSGPGDLIRLDDNGNNKL